MLYGVLATVTDRLPAIGWRGMLQKSPQSPAGASVVELVCVVALAFGLVALQLLLAHGWILFTRPLWLDEVHTTLVQYARTPGDVLRYLASGGETHLPTLPLINWAISALTGGLNEWKLRLMSMTAVVLACATVYLMLRRSFPILPAAAGTLLILAHPMVVQYEFEARYYAAFLLFSAGFAAALTGSWKSIRVTAAAIAVTAILLCTSHYYGIFVWAIILVAYVMSGGKHRKAKTRILSASTGPIALLACAPLYFAQQNALSGRTWVPSLSIAQVKQMALEIAPPVPVMLVIALWLAVSRAALNKWERGRPQAWSVDGSWIVLVALAAMPAVLIAVSILLQPTLISRYALPTVLAGGAVVCVAAAGMHRRLQLATVLMLMVAMYVALEAEADYARDFDRRVNSDITAVLSAPITIPIIATSKHALYPLAGKNPEMWRRVAYVDIPDSAVNRTYSDQQRAERAADFMLVERAVARAHHAVFGFPHLIGYAHLKEFEELLLIGTIDSEVERFAGRWLPAHTLTRISPRFYHASRR